MCYELPELTASLLTAAGVEQTGRLTGGQTVFALLHEVGHALIDVLDIPVAGREEDAADQFAAFLLLHLGSVGAEGALSAAYFFGLMHQAQAGAGRDYPFWDEHSMDAQRFYNILCWLYGSDPARYGGLVADGWLPQERAVRCPEETRRLLRSWRALLGPRLRMRR